MAGILINLYDVPNGMVSSTPLILVGRVNANLPSRIETILWNNRWFRYTGEKEQGRRRFERFYPATIMILQDAHVTSPEGK